jgi:hypothetical protein
MESGCLAVSFCVEIYTSGVVFSRVLIPYAPVVGVLWFFFFFSFLVLQQCSSERACRISCLLQGSCCVADFLFFSPQLSWSSHSLMGVQGLSCSHSGEHWVSVPSVGGKPPSTSRVAGCQSVDLRFLFLDRRDVVLLQGGAV